MVDAKILSRGPAASVAVSPVTTALAACTGCNACKRECAFLDRYGAPGEIAVLYQTDPDKCLAIAFECSLCGLCQALCPNAVDAPSLFLEFRQRAFRDGKADFPEHRGILNYEKRGTSKRYTCYSLPETCDTVFFPGCTLPGTRPSVTWKSYLYLKKKISGLGIVLDCCSKPSHDLGRWDAFEAMFHEMRTFLLERGVRQVIVACPNCHKIFSTYGGDLSVRTVYEVMAEDPTDSFLENRGSVAVHDPCPMRFSDHVQAAVRALLTIRGLDVQESGLTKSRTVCCGEGGSVGCMAPELARTWTRKRVRESGRRPIATYCAGCANLLSRDTEVFHLLDLIFEPQRTLAGRAKVSRAPWTYWNRIRLKHRIWKADADVKREREFTFSTGERKSSAPKWILLILMAAAMVGIHSTGLVQSLDTDTLHGLIQGLGSLGPLVYILIYTLAPALFLPGLPITILGGVLFGPFWGVVYAITGATLGASLAFLIARYVSSDFLDARLNGPKWLKLHSGVEKHGWKVVAVVRLIPLFPFNLLNYALGLTPIRFSHYVVTTFFCMLPACVAFIVFSSSLLDLLNGTVSKEFGIGLGLIVLVSLIPFFVHKTKKKGWL